LYCCTQWLTYITGIADSMHCLQQCDDLEDEDSLKQLYYILKGVIMLNSNRAPSPSVSQHTCMRSCPHAS